ncbi:Ig-like domain-containing protein [Treponema berlinense]|uniref:Ig-like domain-containing protein n=1 Tax=Treponema berlinense TaxID=225004 RepID=UPI003F0B9448
MKKMWKALAVLTAIALFGSAFTACKSDDDDDVSVTEVRLDKEKAELKVGETLKLTATVAPTDATNKTVDWSSDNLSVATVGTDGTVTAVAVGDANITVKTKDGGKTATCAITVTEKTSEGGSGSEGGSDDTGDMKVEIKF